MNWWARLLSRRRLERELDAELRDHYERQLRDLLAAGVPEPEARRRARLALGGEDQIKEECRDARGTRWVETIVQDVRYAVRVLAKAPVFTGMAVLSLALGIGANTAIFSIVNGVLLRTLPVREPERLVLLKGGSWTNPIWEEIRRRQTTLFDGAAAWGDVSFDLAAGGPSHMVQGLWVSGGFFDVLGVPMVLGRTFAPEDDRRGGGPQGPVVVISHRFWQQHFGGASDVIGRSLSLDRVSFTVIGVTTPAFTGPVPGRTFDVAVPLGAEPIVRGADTGLDNGWFWWLEVIARLRPAQSIDDATRALRNVQPQIRRATCPEECAGGLGSYLAAPFELAPAAGGAPQFRDRYQQPLLTLMITVGLVLLIACANIANLMLARADTRRHELSLRRAMGASGPRLARQLFSETVLLAAVGAILGGVLGMLGARLLVGQLTTSREIVFLDLSLDWRVLAFTTVVTVGTALIFGLVPALRAARIDPGEVMKQHARTIAAGRSGMLGQPLVVAQIALSLVLLVGGGLFIRTFVALTQQGLGFEREGLLLVMLDVGQTSAPPADRPALYERLEAAVGHAPGIGRAALSVVTPVSGQGWNADIDVLGEVPLSGRDRMVWLNGVGRHWFATYGIRLLAGREFAESDRTGSPLVAIVNQAFVTKFVRNADPIGRVIRRGVPGGEPLEMQIVGVVENTPYRQLREGTPPIVYVPHAQQEVTWPSQTLTVRASLSSVPVLTKAIADVVASVDRDVSLTFVPLADSMDGLIVRERLLAILSAFFAGLALLLAGVGLYGVTSYNVSRRRMEIGVRMALGADASAVVRLVLVRVCGLLTAGLLVGTLASLWLSTLVRALLYRMEPHDPATLVGAGVVLSAVALLAAWLPARRAAGIDPARVIREG